jgi:hypothetical protein
MKAVALCARMRKGMNWYREQPQWFLNALSSFFNEQDEEAKRKAKP